MKRFFNFTIACTLLLFSIDIIITGNQAIACDSCGGGITTDIIDGQSVDVLHEPTATSYRWVHLGWPTFATKPIVSRSGATQLAADPNATDWQFDAFHLGLNLGWIMLVSAALVFVILIPFIRRESTPKLDHQE